MELHNIFKAVWETKTVPAKWATTRLATIWKNKGSQKDPAHYRALQVSTILIKITSSIIVNRIKEWYESQLLEYQMGFRKEKGTSEAIFILRILQQIVHQTNRSFYLVFADLTAAFDKMCRSFTWRSIYQRLPETFDKTNFQILENLYTKTTAEMDILEPINVEIDVMQGGTESALIFNLFIDYVMRKIIHESKKVGVHFPKITFRIPSDVNKKDTGEQNGTTEIPYIGFADDTTALAESAEDLQTLVKIMAEVFQDFHLILNLDKTKTMIIQNQSSEQIPKTIVSINNVPIQNVAKFKILGALLNQNPMESNMNEIKSKIMMAQKQFGKKKNILQSRKIFLQTRVQILNTTIRPVLLYSVETMALTKQHLRKIESFYINLLRQMVNGGTKRNDNHSYFYTNFQIMEITKTNSIIDHVFKLQQRFLGHQIRKENSNLIKQIIFHEAKSMKIGRPIKTLLIQVVENMEVDISQFYRMTLKRYL